VIAATVVAATATGISAAIRVAAFGAAAAVAGIA
jgi:hypothetical protein